MRATLYVTGRDHWVTGPLHDSSPEAWNIARSEPHHCFRMYQMTAETYTSTLRAIESAKDPVQLDALARILERSYPHDHDAMALLQLITVKRANIVRRS